MQISLVGRGGGVSAEPVWEYGYTICVAQDQLSCQLGKLEIITFLLSATMESLVHPQLTKQVTAVVGL